MILAPTCPICLLACAQFYRAPRVEQRVENGGCRACLCPAGVPKTCWPACAPQGYPQHGGGGCLPGCAGLGMRQTATTRVVMQSPSAGFGKAAVRSR